MFFFFNDTATTEIYTLSLHDALPISRLRPGRVNLLPFIGGTVATHHGTVSRCRTSTRKSSGSCSARSEEHTSELQSRQYLVCRLLLEKKNPYTRLDSIVPIRAYPVFG